MSRWGRKGVTIQKAVRENTLWSVEFGNALARCAMKRELLAWVSAVVEVREAQIAVLLFGQNV
jgi:hypothetical protein